ncbi:flagellar hook-basal body protein FliE [Hyphomicrobium methylovorum]|uniref:flagellar hook-basal body complex protein FliE n=1 Tax=Hyphomicrobium methylovorum TaxID=84 RepID=UPI0015E6C81C|nr:flagellar hook-basal body complex protein FliE [Hyphomicrobium methylovorum]MBA2125954.1 flagellar hook-basal body protein FliE [Hyphomicrobium methylovorum]
MSLPIAMVSPEIGGIGGVVRTVPTAKPAGVPEPGSDFAQTMAAMAADAITTIKAGEATATAGIKGQASVQQVVQAVMQAEQTLQTVVAVRDKVVSAYLEISRMQI